MKPNWFIALPISPESWFPERVGSAPDRVRRFHPDDLHVTVAFLGGCGEDVARRAWDDARQHPGPALSEATLDRVAPMGSKRRPSALSALFAEGVEPLSAFIATHRERWLELAGARPDTRPPKPHCTLARIHRRANKPQRRAALRWAAELDVAGVPVRVRRLALYTWALDRSERLFRVVERAEPG